LRFNSLALLLSSRPLNILSTLYMGRRSSGRVVVGHYVCLPAATVRLRVICSISWSLLYVDTLPPARWRSLGNAGPARGLVCETITVLPSVCVVLW